MKAKLLTQSIQGLLLVPQDGIIGPITRAHFNLLANTKPSNEYTGEVPLAQDLGHAGETGARDINERAANLVKHFESCPLKAYQDEVGVWTIGWGHTGLQHKDGTVYAGRVITQVKADALFKYDMEQFEARVCAFVKVPLNDDQYGALVSFDFNTGGLGKSSLLRRLNDGDYQGAADGLLAWNKAGGTIFAGLVRRRRSERRLFMGKDNYILRDMDAVRADERGELG